MKEEIILGLDISTKTIGVTLFKNDESEHGEIIKMSHISPSVKNKLPKIEQLFLKKKIFKNEFLNQYKTIGINRVIIEAPLLRSQNVNTIATLLQFNGMISDCVYEELGIVPEYISSYDARRYAFPDLMSVRKYNKKGEIYDLKHFKKAIKENNLVLFGNYPWDIDKKQILLSKVADIYKNIEFIFDKYDNLKQENFDATDSLVAILGKLSYDKYSKCDFVIDDSFINEDKKEIKHILHFGDKEYTKILALE